VTQAAIQNRLRAELGEPVRLAGVLGRPRTDRRTWAADAEGIGPLVVKARRGDWADEKTRWCAENLPLLAARGYPAPEILWHGALDAQWYVVVQRRLPGAPIAVVDPPIVDALMDLVELQADAPIDPGPRDFAEYQAYVLFDGWDHVWRDADTASGEAARLCDRLRRWLQPVWGLRLPACDFANNDLNLTNVLADGATITGVVDWDEFGLNSRGADLAALAFDCEWLGARDAARRLLERIEAIAGEDGLRCLVAYRALAHVAARGRRGGAESARDSARVGERLLDLAGAG
jgi:aminoglycoside phosphotransferase (APT) family kinase protein